MRGTPVHALLNASGQVQVDVDKNPACCPGPPRRCVPETVNRAHAPVAVPNTVAR